MRLLTNSVVSIGFLVFLPIQLFAGQDQQLEELGGDLMPSLLKLAGGMILVLLLIYGFVWLLKRFSQGKQGVSGNLISVIERYHLSPKQAIYLIKVAEKHILIGATESGIARITDIELNEETSSASMNLNKRPSSKFNQILRQARQSLLPMISVADGKLEHES